MTVALVALAAGMVAPPGKAAALPVAAYSFDAGAGTTLVDSSGHGNTGTISGATWTPAGKHGGALSFDGLDDVVTVADSPSLDLTRALTLEAWVKPAQTLGATWRTVIFKEQPRQLAYALYANDSSRAPSGHVHVGEQRAVAGRSQLPPGTWQHIAVTYDGSALRLYVGGQLAGRANVSGTIHSSDAPLRIGRNDVWGESFAGLVDDVRIYDRALSQAEVRRDTDAPAGTTARARSDRVPPAAPRRVRVPGRTKTTISLSWSVATDKGIAGYDVFRGATRIGSTTGKAYTVRRLACGKSYQLGITSHDAAGNRSRRAAVRAATAGCAASDKTAPPRPTGLRVTSTSATSISVAWSVPRAKAGRSGFGAYRNGSRVGSTAASTYSFRGLSCATRYTLAVDAYDRAGNRSGKAQVRAATAGCPLPGNADLYVSPTGSDSNACTRVAPCRSFSRAFKAAKPGAVVEVAGGSYPEQKVLHDAAKPLDSARVLFRPAAGQTVNVSGLENWASNVHYVGFRLPTGTGGDRGDGIALVRAGKNVTIEDFVATKPHVWNADPPNVRVENLLVLGGNFGPHGSCGGGSQIIDNPKNVTIDGATFHDFYVPSSCAGAHLDCVHTFGSDGLTIRNSRFVRCENFGILVNGGRNITIENNFLTGGIYGFKLRGDNDPSIERFDNVTIRFNSADEINLGSNNSNTLNNVRVENNATVKGIGCRSTASFSGNISQNSGTCNRSDRALPNLGFRDPGKGDFHLEAGSPLINAATGASHPTKDIDGQRRPAGTRADVGADERP